MIIDKYNKRAKTIDSLLCIGLDPDFEKLPERFKAMNNPQFEFNKWIIHETHEFAAAYKPNVAFYEAKGIDGIFSLKQTMEYLQEKHPNIVTILDAKRADIGETNTAYVTYIFDWLGFDAVTLHPYLGKESLRPFLERKDKVSIILCRTTNPGAGELQDLIVGGSGEPLWQFIAEKVTKEWDTNKNCMLVVGANYTEEMRIIRSIAPEMTFLVPGVGAQGGSVRDVMESGKNSEGLGLIINSSRAIIFADNPAEEARKLRDEIRKYK